MDPIPFRVDAYDEPIHIDLPDALEVAKWLRTRPDGRSAAEAIESGPRPVVFTPEDKRIVEYELTVRLMFLSEADYPELAKLRDALRRELGPDLNS